MDGRCLPPRASGGRYFQIKTRENLDSSKDVEKTHYLGSYERETHGRQAAGAGSTIFHKTVHRHSIGGFAVYTRTEDSGGGSVRLSTILKDHLGSTDCIVTGTWNGTSFSNHQTERQSFDPWGERRDPATFVNFRAADTDPFRTSAADYDRGFTGHEQLDDSGLIHMNGRIYDPELGRMLSPDPFVQVPEYSQNFNRYSYVLNNPLNKTDPTGYSWLSKAFDKVGDWLSENWRTVVSIVVGVVLFFVLGPGAFGVAGMGLQGAQLGAAVGASMGAFNAAINGGNLGEIAKGALVGGIQGGITGGFLHNMEGVAEMSGQWYDKAAHIVGHGVVGGAANEAMGGKFQDGFLSAAAGAYAGWTLLKNTTIGNTLGSTVGGRTAIAGIVGGTASAIGGGKFANGAWTAAFQHLLNAEGGFWQKAVNGAFGRNGEGFKLEVGERAALYTFGSDPWHSNPELREYITELAAKNNIDVELLRAVIYNETGTRLGGATTEAWISSHSDYGTYGPAQLGPEARSFADLSIADSLTMRGGLKGAAAWLGFQKGLLEVNVHNPTNAQIASRYNQGRIYPGTVNRYGARIQWIISNRLPVHDAHPYNNR